MGDKILKGSLDFDQALKILGKMNEKIDEALELVYEITSDLFGGWDGNEEKKARIKELLEEVKALKTEALKALVLLDLYTVMSNLDDMISEAEQFIYDNYKDSDSPEKKKKTKEELVERLKKIKSEKDSIEKRLPKNPDSKWDWMGIINKYLDPYIQGRLMDNEYTRKRLEEMLPVLHRFKKHAIRMLPAKLCGEKMDWWYERFKIINEILDELIDNAEGKYMLFLISVMEDLRILQLQTLKDYKDEVEEKIENFKKYI